MGIYRISGTWILREGDTLPDSRLDERVSLEREMARLGFSPERDFGSPRQGRGVWALEDPRLSESARSEFLKWAGFSRLSEKRFINGNEKEGNKNLGPYIVRLGIDSDHVYIIHPVPGTLPVLEVPGGVRLGSALHSGSDVADFHSCSATWLLSEPIDHFDLILVLVLFEPSS
ncbi:hypothetical protein Lal_00013368 [Lupinus albus]|nr:hypothetical protein Lal_00013368 [Lupinus albus]